MGRDVLETLGARARCVLAQDPEEMTLIISGSHCNHCADASLRQCNTVAFGSPLNGLFK